MSDTGVAASDGTSGTAGSLAADRSDGPRAHHDMGGVPKFMCEAIETEAHALTRFDKEVDAIRQILGAKGVMSVDELRRGIEAIPEAEYHRLSYYQRWIRSIADNLLARGVVTEEELGEELGAEIGAEPSAAPSGQQGRAP